MALAIGDTFKSFSTLQKAITAFEKTSFANFFISHSRKLKLSQRKKIAAADIEKFKYQAIYYRCKYSGKCTSKSRKNARKSYSYKGGCGASITVNYKDKKSAFEISAICTEHNHDRSMTIFGGLPKQRHLSIEEKQVVNQIVKVNPNMRLLQKDIMEKTGKTILLKDLHNIRQSANATEQNDLQGIFDEIQTRDDVVAELFVTENELQGIYIQDKRMKKYFDLYPDVLMMDATYKLNDRRMPLFLMLVIDGNGESQIAAMCIIKSENYDIISKTLNTFKIQNPKHDNINVILSDKNFADRRAYAEAFPKAQLQLCIFHVLQNFKREISTKRMGITGEQKKEVLEILQRMVYATTEKKYLDLYQELCELNFEKVREYFDKNWHADDVRSQWAAYFTNSSQNYMNRTTNRLESINQKLKSVVTKYSKLHIFLKATLDCIQSLGLERDQRTIRSIHRRPVNIINETVDEHAYRALLTAFALDKLLGEKYRMGHVVFVGEVNEQLIYKSHENATTLLSVDQDGKSCTCPFFKQMGLPCRHLLKYLMEREMDLYVPALCNQRWLKSHLPSDLVGDMNYIQNQKTVSQTEKFHIANVMLTRVAEKLSELSTPKFQTFMAELQKVEGYLEQEILFVINEIDAGNEIIFAVEIRI